MSKNYNFKFATVPDSVREKRRKKLEKGQNRSRPDDEYNKKKKKPEYRHKTQMKYNQFSETGKGISYHIVKCTTVTVPNI